ncbi:MAG: hypothetical protein ACTH3D_12220 [Halomonas sp.]|uniref:hypothetical protein n=1 Tax=Halomonas sp. TaxID=1486246 RepID=UPI003F8F4034
MEKFKKYSLYIAVAIILLCFLFPITRKVDYPYAGYVLRFIFLPTDSGRGSNASYYIDEIKWMIQIFVGVVISAIVVFQAKNIKK